MIFRIRYLLTVCLTAACLPLNAASPIDRLSDLDEKEVRKKECELRYSRIYNMILNMNKDLPGAVMLDTLATKIKMRRNLYIKTCSKLTTVEMDSIAFLSLLIAEFKDSSSLNLDLPEASPVSKQIKPDSSLEINITKRGRYFFILKSNPGNKNGHKAKQHFKLSGTSINTIKRAIKKITKGNAKTKIYIRADSKSPHSSFVKVMDALQSLGIHKISIITAQQKK